MSATFLLLLQSGTTPTPPVQPLSLVARAMSSALGVLASAVGQALRYRATTAGTFATLPGALLQQGAPVLIGYDERRNAIMAPMTARLKVPVGGVHLTPGAANAQVKDQNGTVWQVVGVSHANGQSIYELQRAIVSSQGDARGTVP